MLLCVAGLGCSVAAAQECTDYVTQRVTFTISHVWLLVRSITNRGSREITGKSRNQPAVPNLRVPFVRTMRVGARMATLNQCCGDSANRNAAVAARSAIGAVLVSLHRRFPIPACSMHRYAPLLNRISRPQSTGWIPVSLAAVGVGGMVVVCGVAAVTLFVHQPGVVPAAGGHPMKAYVVHDNGCSAVPRTKARCLA